MENTLSIKRSEKISKFPEKYLESLEDKQVDLLDEFRRTLWLSYRKEHFWSPLLIVLFCWLIVPAVVFAFVPGLALPMILFCGLIVPVFLWKNYKQKHPEWDTLQRLNQELAQLKQKRKQRKFWKKVWSQKNQLRTESFQEINQFYRTLIHSMRQYNTRLDLFDYALDRQNKHLDPPFTVGELEQIELTFQRIYDELNSALKLLEVAEQNPEMDLATFLNDQYSHLETSTEFVSQTIDMADSGKFVQELLLIETDLKKEIASLFQQK